MCVGVWGIFFMNGPRSLSEGFFSRLGPSCVWREVDLESRSIENCILRLH